MATLRKSAAAALVAKTFQNHLLADTIGSLESLSLPSYLNAESRRRILSLLG